MIYLLYFYRPTPPIGLDAGLKPYRLLLPEESEVTIQVYEGLVEVSLGKQKAFVRPGELLRAEGEIGVFQKELIPLREEIEATVKQLIIEKTKKEIQEERKLEERKREEIKKAVSEETPEGYIETQKVRFNRREYRLVEKDIPAGLLVNNIYDVKENFRKYLDYYPAIRVEGKVLKRQWISDTYVILTVQGEVFPAKGFLQMEKFIRIRGSGEIVFVKEDGVWRPTEVRVSQPVIERIRLVRDALSYYLKLIESLGIRVKELSH